MIDIITHRIVPNHLIWFNVGSLSNIKLTETLRYGMLEVQEHLETFCDKKDQATMVHILYLIVFDSVLVFAR